MNMRENTSEPLISILINSYNGEKFVEKCLDSVFKQTYKNWEIIFWDNKSTDNTKEIIKKYKDKRVRYFQSKIHTNLSKARNLALLKCKSDYVAFLDVDDSWSNDKLQMQVKKIILNNKARIIITDSNLISNCNISAQKNNLSFISPIIKKIFKDQNKLIFIQNYIVFSSVLINKKGLYLKFDEELNQAEDYDLILQLASHGLIIKIEKKLTTYFIHNRNLSHYQYEKNFTESIYLLKKYIKNKYAFCGLSLNYFLYSLFLFKKYKIFLGFKNKIFSIYYLLKFFTSYGNKI